MQKKKAPVYSMLGLTVFIATSIILSYAWTYTEKREVLLTTSFTIEGGEQKFKAFYLSAPAEGFEIKINVSNGSIKFSPFSAREFEETLGYHQHYINETTVEMVQPWFFEADNGTAGCSTDDANQVWYLLFCNEDSYGKEIQIQITKVWKEQNYQTWI